MRRLYGLLLVFLWGLASSCQGSSLSGRFDFGESRLLLSSMPQTAEVVWHSALLLRWPGDEERRVLALVQLPGVGLRPAFGTKQRVTSWGGEVEVRRDVAMQELSSRWQVRRHDLPLTAPVGGEVVEVEGPLLASPRVQKTKDAARSSAARPWTYARAVRRASECCELQGEELAKLSHALKMAELQDALSSWGKLFAQRGLDKEQEFVSKLMKQGEIIIDHEGNKVDLTQCEFLFRQFFAARRVYISPICVELWPPDELRKRLARFIAFIALLTNNEELTKDAADWLAAVFEGLVLGRDEAYQSYALRTCRVMRLASIRAGISLFLGAKFALYVEAMLYSGSRRAEGSEALTSLSRDLERGVEVQAQRSEEEVKALAQKMAEIFQELNTLVHEEDWEALQQKWGISREDVLGSQD